MKNNTETAGNHETQTETQHTEQRQTEQKETSRGEQGETKSAIETNSETLAYSLSTADSPAQLNETIYVVPETDTPALADLNLVEGMLLVLLILVGLLLGTVWSNIFWKRGGF